LEGTRSNLEDAADCLRAWLARETSEEATVGGLIVASALNRLRTM
jgi:hypothetical protein